MAKANQTTKWVGVIITVLVLITSIVGTWAVKSEEIEVNKEDIANLSLSILENNSITGMVYTIDTGVEIMGN